MERNVAGNVTIFAFDYSTGAPKTGDQANITLYTGNSTAGFTPVAMANTTVLQVDSSNAPGLYLSRISAGETNYVEITLTGKSSTANVALVPQRITLTPANFSLESVDGSGRVLLQPAQSNITANIVGTWTGSMTGNIGAVTGNIGGNVIGSVASVTGNVAAVTGHVGGNVLGSTASVTGAVGSVTANVSADVVLWKGGVVATPDSTGHPKVTIKSGTGTGEIQLSGGNVTQVTNAANVTLATTSRAPIRKNTALTAFPILMTDSTNHNPATGKTVTVQRSIDGGALGSGTLGSVTEISNGWYEFDFGAGDLNGDTIAVRATATGCDDLNFTIVTSP